MSSVTVLHAVAIFSVFAVGLIAGQMLAIGIANYAARGLPETSWTLRFQSENNLFAKTMPPFLIAPAIGLVTLFFLAHDDARGMFAAAAVLILIVLGNNDGDQCADQQAGAIVDCRSCSVDLDVHERQMAPVSPGSDGCGANVLCHRGNRPD